MKHIKGADVFRLDNVGAQLGFTDRHWIPMGAPEPKPGERPLGGFFAPIVLKLMANDPNSCLAGTWKISWSGTFYEATFRNQPFKGPGTDPDGKYGDPYGKYKVYDDTDIFYYTDGRTESTSKRSEWTEWQLNHLAKLGPKLFTTTHEVTGTFQRDPRKPLNQQFSILLTKHSATPDYK